jgi:hypothetical protein
MKNYYNLFGIRSKATQKQAVLILVREICRRLQEANFKEFGTWEQIEILHALSIFSKAELRLSYDHCLARKNPASSYIDPLNEEENKIKTLVNKVEWQEHVTNSNFIQNKGQAIALRVLGLDFLWTNRYDDQGNNEKSRTGAFIATGLYLFFYFGIPLVLSWLWPSLGLSLLAFVLLFRFRTEYQLAKVVYYSDLFNNSLH